jgi:hypothetical protein
MSILTTRELEFLASLRTRWHQDYLREVERLLEEDDDHATTDQQPLDKGRQSTRALQPPKLEIDPQFSLSYWRL